MGFIDNVSSAIDRGTNAAGRKTREIKLNSQMNDVNKRRQGFAAQLGASLYEATKDDPTFREGRETLYDSIAACDEERARIQKELADIKAEAEADSAAAHSFSCAVCGARMTEADLFCSGCGTPAAQAHPVQPSATPVAPAGPVCPSCGATIAQGDLFCMSCGSKVEQPQPVETPAAQPAGPVCPSCGAEVAQGDMFCMSCGTKIESPEPPTPAADAVPVPIPEPVGAPVEVPEPSDEPVAAEEPESAAAPEAEEAPADAPEPEEEADEVPAAPVDEEAAPVPESVPTSEPVPEPEPVAVAPMCASCGTPLGPNDKFCKSCGTRVGEIS